MREVSKEKFYETIGPLDVVSSLREVRENGHIDYEHSFHKRYSSVIIGKIIPKLELDKYPYFVKHYYLY